MARRRQGGVPPRAPGSGAAWAPPDAAGWRQSHASWYRPQRDHCESTTCLKSSTSYTKEENGKREHLTLILNSDFCLFVCLGGFESNSSFEIIFWDIPVLISCMILWILIFLPKQKQLNLAVKCIWKSSHKKIIIINKSEKKILECCFVILILYFIILRACVEVPAMSHNQRILCTKKKNNIQWIILSYCKLATTIKYR